MTDWSIALIIVISFLLLLFTGLPIAFTLAGLSALLLLVFLGPSALFMMVAATTKMVGEEVFLAIPLFIFMAAVLQFSGIAAALYQTMYMWMGPLRGGLAMGTSFICAIIDAMSGIGATATTTMGLIALPEMYKRKYNKHMVLGCIASGGALGPLIPPSVLMIIVGGYAQVSVGKLFIGGFIPGFLITFCWMAYVGIRCAIREQDGPALSPEEAGRLKEKLIALRNVIAPIILIVATMGSIYSGICTPTEAASVGAVGALIIACYNRQLNWPSLRQALLTTTRINCMVMWIVVGGGAYSTLITVTGTSHFLSEVIKGLPLSPIGVLIVMLIINLIMGCFIDAIAISMICLPIFVPIVTGLGIDILWFMLLFTIALVTGYITPPFGVNIFYMKGVAPPETTMKDVYKGVLPYALIMIACLGLCVAFPSLCIWLPNRMIK